MGLPRKQLNCPLQLHTGALYKSSIHTFAGDADDAEDADDDMCNRDHHFADAAQRYVYRGKDECFLACYHFRLERADDGSFVIRSNVKESA